MATRKKKVNTAPTPVADLDSSKYTTQQLSDAFRHFIFEDEAWPKSLDSIPQHSFKIGDRCYALFAGGRRLYGSGTFIVLDCVGPLIKIEPVAGRSRKIPDYAVGNFFTLR